MAWAVPAFDLKSFCTVDSGLTARKGLEPAGSCRDHPLISTWSGFVFFLPLYREKVCSLSELYFDIAGCLVRDRGQLWALHLHTACLMP